VPTSDPRIPARFDPDPWDEDLARSTPAGQTAGLVARRDYELRGVPVSHLKACEAEGSDGTRLPDCLKAYIPQPDGKFGMVFTIDRATDKPALLFLAFGIRHHPRESRALTVYEIADRRLNA
jgi:hypothetical protein